MRPIVTLFTFSRLNVGGMERYLQQLAEHLADRYRFHLFAPAMPQFVEEIQAIDPGVIVEHVPRYGKLDPRGPAALRRSLRRHGTALLHTQDPRSRLVGVPTARGLGVPTLHTFHMTALSYGARGLKRLVYEQAERALNARTDALIYVSEADRNLYRQRSLLPQSNHQVIHNSTNLDAFQTEDRSAARRALRMQLDLSPDRLVASTLARLHPQKGIDVLIKAVQHLRETTTLPLDALPCFAVMGDGELRESLEQQIEAAGLHDVIRLMGQGTREEARTLLLGSDLYVLPSRYECLPISLIEAIAARLPVVATDVGGNAEVVAHEKNGVVVPSDDPPALAEALQRIVTDAALREQFGAESSRRAQAFSPEVMIEKTETLYQRLARSQGLDSTESALSVA